MFNKDCVCHACAKTMCEGTYMYVRHKHIHASVCTMLICHACDTRGTLGNCLYWYSLTRETDAPVSSSICSDCPFIIKFTIKGSFACDDTVKSVYF